MTRRLPLHGTTLSRGRINDLTAQLTPSQKRLSGLFGRFAVALLLGALAGCDPGGNYSKHVELVTGSPEPVPGMTFELRFESTMVKGDGVGTEATNSPLVIEPPLAGHFTWLSTRSGVFTPSEPLALDRTYELSLQPGLQSADGRPCGASLHWTLTTPPFDLMASSPRQADANACSEPEAKLVFNPDVRAADVIDDVV